MRKVSFATLGLLALLAAGSAFGQFNMRVNVPFEFRVGTDVMPAGQYEVNLSLSQNQMSLSSASVPKTSHTTYKVGGYSNDLSRGRLVFHKYEDTYFLSEVWTSQSGMGSALPRSKAEREVSRRASLEQPGQAVLLALR